MNLRKIKQIILGYAIKKECPLNLSNTYNLFTFSPLLSSEKGLKINTLIQKIYLLYSSIVKLNNISAIRNLFFFTRVHLRVTSCKQLFDFTITHSIFYLYWSIRQSQKIVLLAVWQPALRKLEKICSCNSYQKQRSKHRWGSLLFSYCSFRLM